MFPRSRAFPSRIRRAATASLVVLLALAVYVVPAVPQSGAYAFDAIPDSSTLPPNLGLVDVTANGIVDVYILDRLGRLVLDPARSGHRLAGSPQFAPDESAPNLWMNVSWSGQVDYFDLAPGMELARFQLPGPLTFAPRSAGGGRYNGVTDAGEVVDWGIAGVLNTFALRGPLQFEPQEAGPGGPLFSATSDGFFEEWNPVLGIRSEFQLLEPLQFAPTFVAGGNYEGVSWSGEYMWWNAAGAQDNLKLDHPLQFAHVDLGGGIRSGISPSGYVQVWAANPRAPGAILPQKAKLPSPMQFQAQVFPGNVQASASPAGALVVWQVIPAVPPGTVPALSIAQVQLTGPLQFAPILSPPGVNPTVNNIQSWIGVTVSGQFNTVTPNPGGNPPGTVTSVGLPGGPPQFAPISVGPNQWMLISQNGILSIVNQGPPPVIVSVLELPGPLQSPPQPVPSPPAPAGAQWWKGTTQSGKTVVFQTAPAPPMVLSVTR